MATSLSSRLEELHQETRRVELDLSYYLNPKGLGRALGKLGAMQTIKDLYDEGMLTETEAGFALCQLENETP